MNCDSGKCYTEVTAEWLPKGQLQYTLTRACFDPKKFEEPKPTRDCTLQAPLEAYQRSSCKTLCKGEKCNENWTELGEQLSGAKNVESCHQCRYIEKDDGTTIGHKVVFRFNYLLIVNLCLVNLPTSRKKNHFLNPVFLEA